MALRGSYERGARRRNVQGGASASAEADDPRVQGLTGGAEAPTFGSGTPASWPGEPREDVAGHLGRCRAYVVVEAVGEEIRGSRVVASPHVGTHRPGQIPRFIRGLGVDAVLAGGMGPRAISVFSRYGIEQHVDVRGRES